jgi:hypothetical protein
VSRRSNGSMDTPWHRGGSRSFGKVGHASGAAPELLSRGWLPRNAAALVLGMTLRELDRAVREGVIRKRRIGPDAVLYEVK